MFKIYNVKNHALNSDRRIDLDRFATSGFGGIIANEEPIDVTVPCFVALNTHFICEGVSIDVADEVFPTTSESNYFVGLEVKFVDGGNIKTDETTDIKLKTYTPSAMSYVDNKFTFTLNGNEYEYVYKAVDLGADGFMIPLLMITGGTKTSIVAYSDGSFDDALTQSAYDRLKTYVEETFVWHEGGETLKGSYKKGQIGNLIVTGNLIKNVTDGNSVSIRKLNINNTTSEYVEPERFPHVDNNNDVTVASNWAIQPTHGGIGNAAHRESRNTAREILGIYSGTTAPESYSFPYAVADGDIYFKIIE